MSIKAMDVYSSRMDIPFSVAAYCRGHKFSVEAVNYARAIQEFQKAEEDVRRAQEFADSAEAKMLEARKAVEEKMERTNGV